jgi:zinc transport system permease protein
VGSVVLSAFFTVIGLWLSYAFNLTSGASIILVAGIFFLLFLPLEHVVRRSRS